MRDIVTSAINNIIIKLNVICFSNYKESGFKIVKGRGKKAKKYKNSETFEYYAQLGMCI